MAAACGLCKNSAPDSNDFVKCTNVECGLLLHYYCAGMKEKTFKSLNSEKRKKYKCAKCRGIEGRPTVTTRNTTALEKAIDESAYTETTSPQTNMETGVLNTSSNRFPDSTQRSLGIFAMLYPVFLTVYAYFKLDLTNVVIKTEPDSIAQVCAVVPVLCLAYQSQEVVVPVYACMKERTIHNFAKACFLAMGFLLFIHSVIGCFGYLTFGTLVQPNIMKMYDARDPIVMVGVGALIIKMIVSFPVLALCGRGAVDGLYAELRNLSAADFIDGEKKRRFVIASLWFSSALLIALCTSSIGKVINILSSVTAINVFVYPGICLMQVTLKKDRDLKRWRSRLLILGSIFFVTVGTFFFGIVLFNFGNSTTATIEPLCSPSS